MVACSDSQHADGVRRGVAAEGRMECVNHGDAELGGLLHWCSVTGETPVLTHLGVGWGPCKHRTHHLSTALPSVSSGAC